MSRNIDLGVADAEAGAEAGRVVAVRVGQVDDVGQLLSSHRPHRFLQLGQVPVAPPGQRSSECNKPCSLHNTSNAGDFLPPIRYPVIHSRHFNCCEAQGKGRAKGRPREVTQRSFMDGGWWMVVYLSLMLYTKFGCHHHHCWSKSCKFKLSSFIYAQFIRGFCNMIIFKIISNYICLNNTY